MSVTLVAPTGRVHWLGTGLSTGSGLALVAEAAAHVTIWGRTGAKAQACRSRLGLDHQADARALDPAALRDAIAPGDLVVSMLPATEHGGVLRSCIDGGAHFACSSYVSDAVAELAPTAAERGLVVLTEAGLDPGIDHLLAHDLVARARAETDGRGDATVEFTSYCGSIPAVPNDFRYRFSWAPRGVLTALLTEARYIDDGAVRVAPRPWEALREHTVGAERFEVYPNRDSIPFVEVYRFPDHWRPDTFIRGTMRHDGWRAAWDPIFAEVVSADDGRITELAHDLARRYPTTATDHDRVVLSVSLSVRTGDGTGWSGEYALDVVGDERETATTRLVSTGLACGLVHVLAGRANPGLHRAVADPTSVRQWLAYLDKHGIQCQFIRNVPETGDSGR